MLHMRACFLRRQAPEHGPLKNPSFKKVLSRVPATNSSFRQQSHTYNLQLQMGPYRVVYTSAAAPML
jgi:hypothetical protein